MIMLIVQHNGGCGHKSTMIAMENALDIRARIILLQEPFIGNQELVYSAFKFYWLQRDRTTIRFMTAMRKDLLDKIIIDHRTDLVNQPYFIFPEI